MKRHPLILIALTVLATLAVVHMTGCGATRLRPVARGRQGLRRARRAGQVLRLPLRRPERIGVRRRHSIRPSDSGDSCVRAARRLRLCDERQRSAPTGAGRHRRRLGRHASPDSVGDRRRAERQVSLDQRSRQRTPGADSARLLRGRSHRQDSEPAGRARHRGRLAEHEVHRRQRRVRAADRRPRDQSRAVHVRRRVRRSRHHGR